MGIPYGLCGKPFWFIDRLSALNRDYVRIKDASCHQYDWTEGKLQNPNTLLSFYANTVVHDTIKC